MTQTQEILFRLIRSAIGTAAESIPSDFSDWNVLIDMSFEQGVAALCVDGYNALLEKNVIDDSTLLIESEELEDLKFGWFGSVMQEEEKCRRQNVVTRSLAEFYRQHGIKMMLLKGYGLSLNYPVPEHRPVGDIDIYLFGDWKEADAEIRKLGVKVDESHHHHSVFYYKGQGIENHFDFVNVHSHLSGRKVENRFKELASVPGKEIMPNVYLPQPNLNALFVARHAAIHFASGELVLRQLLDWALLTRSLTQDIDWVVFWKDVEQMGMLPFVLVMVQVAVECFGLDFGIFHLPEGCAPNAELTRRVLLDTLDKEFSEEAPKGFTSYWSWMLRRWLANRWKHSLVYSDSLLSTFASQTVSHLMKPESLRG